MIIPVGISITSDVINSSELDIKLYMMNNKLAIIIELIKELVIAFLSYFMSPNFDDL